MLSFVILIYLLFRFRRDVLEGTYEELLEKFDEEINSRGNNSTSRGKRQSDYPGPIESNTSSGKYEIIIYDSFLCSSQFYKIQ